MAIAQSFIQELLARADVVEVVGRYVQLKKSDANFMGLCPFQLTLMLIVIILR